MLGEAPINYQRDGIQRTGALVGATRQDSTAGQSRGSCGKGVLPLVIVRTGDVERRGDRVPRAEPGRLQDSVGWESRVVDRTGNEAARDERTGVQRIIRIGELDMLIATEQLPRSDRVAGGSLEHGVVGSVTAS